MNWTLPLAKSLWAAERRTSSTIDARRGASAFPAALMSHRSSQRKRIRGADGPTLGAELGQTAAPPLIYVDDDDDDDDAADDDDDDAAGSWAVQPRGELGAVAGSRDG